MRAEAQILEEAEEFTKTTPIGQETPEQLAYRVRVLRTAQDLRERGGHLPARPEQQDQEQPIAPIDPEEAEWKGESPSDNETIPETVLPVMEIGEGLRAKPIEGLDDRPLEARFHQPMRPGDFLEFRFSGVLLQRLKVVNRVGNLPDDALYATLLHESPETNEFVEEVMRLQGSIQTKAARFSRRENPRVWTMNVSSDGAVSLATLRDPQDVVREAEALRQIVDNGHNASTEILVSQLFKDVPVSRE